MRARPGVKVGDRVRVVSGPGFVPGMPITGEVVQVGHGFLLIRVASGGVKLEGDRP